MVLLILSVAYGCRFLLEQPQGSKAEEHERLVELFRAYWIFKGAIWGGAYADNRAMSSPKRHWLYSNDDKLLSELGLAAGRLTGQELAEMTGPPLVKKQKREDGTSSFTGNKDALKESQCHPQSKLLLCPILNFIDAIALHTLRTYHPKFGMHLAQLKGMMGSSLWKVGFFFGTVGPSIFLGLLRRCRNPGRT